MKKMREAKAFESFGVSQSKYYRIRNDKNTKFDYKKARYSEVPRDSVPGADKVKLKNKTMQFLFGD